ncbi:site-specific DNA-methyltransferase [Collinsella sp. AM20-15AC]|uniref:DNA-methyltransferase n=1 Tax=Collinsella sp. AM20-15AC TaxID=2292029 RepID=UPI0018F2F586|nr:site-specific DNA-methyltransferase [Collinsella sp. AM20-15AC]
MAVELNHVYKMDCIEGMTSLPDNSVDLIIADPPYNLSKGGNWSWDNSVVLKGLGGNWNKVMESWDAMPLEEYWKFTLAWISEAKRILKPSGSMWIFGTYHNIGIINVVCQMLEIEIINEVVWFKRNSFPNLSGRRLTASHETLLWCHSGGKKRQYYFDYDYSKNGVFESDLIKKPGKQMRTVWDVPNNKTKVELKFGKHPTQKPLRLLERIVGLTSKEGDLMLTPFCGSGSECVAAKIAGRDYIGFEIEDEYVELAEKRLENAERGSKLPPKEDSSRINPTLFQERK